MITEPPTLVTDRLVLSGHAADDLDDAVALWSDAEVTKYIGFTRNRQDTWFTMARYRGFWALLGYGYWVVRHRQSGAFVGEVGFADFMRGLEPDISGQPEAGWAFASSAWGQGIGSEAVGAIHHWLDDEGPGGPSVCVIDPANEASVRIAARNGYDRAGSCTYGGTRLDVFRRPPRPLSFHTPRP